MLEMWEPSYLRARMRFLKRPLVQHVVIKLGHSMGMDSTEESMLKSPLFNTDFLTCFLEMHTVGIAVWKFRLAEINSIMDFYLYLLHHSRTLTYADRPISSWYLQMWLHHTCIRPPSTTTPRYDTLVLLTPHYTVYVHALQQLLIAKHSDTIWPIWHIMHHPSTALFPQWKPYWTQMCDTDMIYCLYIACLFKNLVLLMIYWFRVLRSRTCFHLLYFLEQMRKIAFDVRHQKTVSPIDMNTPMGNHQPITSLKGSCLLSLKAPKHQRKHFDIDGNRFSPNIWTL